jgi:hypothetical protein
MTTRRVPQLNDLADIELRLPPQTEEWADDLIRGGEDEAGFEIERTNEALVVRTTVGGNCNALVVARGFLDDLDEYLSEGDVDPMEFTLIVKARPA